MNKTITRRGFLFSMAGTMASLAIGCTTQIPSSFIPILNPLEEGYTEFRNSCPRNCYDTCAMLTYVKDGVIRKVAGDPLHGHTQGKLCVKGYSYVNRVYSPDRLKYPMKQVPRGSGNWVRISWEEAIDTVAKKILDLKKEYGSTLPVCLNKYSGNFGIVHYGVEGVFNSMGYTTQTLGTPCWPAGIDAQGYDFGRFKTSDPTDFANSKYIIIWGANPAWCSIHTIPFIYEAREKGAKIVVIDPILTSTASKADTYVQIKASTDGALALGMAKYILDNNLHDQKFLEQHTVGWPEFKKYLEEKVTLEWASKITEIPVEAIKTLAHEYATTKPAKIWIGYGMQRHTNGGQNVRAIDVLAAMIGSIGIPGGGAEYGHLETWGLSYYGQSFKVPEGSKGVVSVVANLHGGPPEEKMSSRFINMNNFAHDVMNCKEPPVKMMWFSCRNPLSQDPDTKAVEQACMAMDLVVTVDQFVNRSAQFSDLVLPTTTHFEDWDVNVSYWHHWMSINEQAIKPMYEAKNDIEIGMMLSKRMNELEKGSCNFPTSGNLREFAEKEINDAVKRDFGIQSYDDLKKGPKRMNLEKQAYGDRKFTTPSGKYEIFSEAAQKNGLPPIPEYREAMAAPDKFKIRFITPHPQFGLHSQFQNLPWMMNMNPEPFLEMHPQLASQKGIMDGDKVRVYNDLGELTLKVRLTQTVPVDSVVSYEAWFKDNNYCVNYTVKPIPADMGKMKTGNDGIAFHDNFVDVQKM